MLSENRFQTSLVFITIHARIFGIEAMTPLSMVMILKSTAATLNPNPIF
jgi:hypothetical protein